MKPVCLWGSYCDGVGTPIKVVIGRREQLGPPIFTPKVAARAFGCFQTTLESAFLHVAHTVGWPAWNSFEIDLEEIAPTHPLPDSLEGDSLFGTLVVGLAQSVVRAEPGCLNPLYRHLALRFTGIALQHVGVTATLDRDTGRFLPVGCIRDKLDAFCRTDIDDNRQTMGPRLFVLAAPQDLNELRGRCQPDRQLGEPLQEQEKDSSVYNAPYRPLDNPLAVPIVRAYSTIDAFVKLWDIETLSSMRYFR